MLVGLMWAPWLVGLQTTRRVRVRQRRALVLVTLLRAQVLV